MVVRGKFSIRTHQMLTGSVASPPGHILYGRQAKLSDTCCRRGHEPLAHAQLTALLLNTHATAG
eukprot:scaffold120012_cov60-Phaeocystis_antarctica.AAC.1